jgi:hypothetical protein
MSRHNAMPPVPPARSGRRTGDDVEVTKDETANRADINTAGQGETANIRQNATNAGFFGGRRIK